MVKDKTDDLKGQLWRLLLLNAEPERWCVNRAEPWKQEKLRVKAREERMLRRTGPKLNALG